MSFLDKLNKLFKKDSPLENHPHDIPMEQKKHENALAEIELRDK
jgi:hypothetical protein